MAKTTCALYPQVNGEDSELYKGLLKLKVGRSLTNLLYASYLQQGVAASLDSNGMKRNKQGEHSAKDVYDYFNTTSIIGDANSITKAKIDLGAIDSNGNKIAIADLVEASNKVKNFNSSHKGLVASIFYNGSEFHYYVGQRDSRTIGLVNEFNKNLNAWKAIKKEFTNAGIDIDAIAKNNNVSSLFNPSKAIEAFNAINTLRNIDSKYLGASNIELLMLLNPSDVGVQSLLRLYGPTPEAAASNIKSILNGTMTVTPARESLVLRTLNRIKSLPNVDMNSISNDISTGIKDVINSTEGQIENTLSALSQQFNLNVSEIILSGKKIKTLEEASGHALMTLQRRLKELNDIADRSAEQENERELLKQDIKDLRKDIEKRQYYNGALKFLTSASEKMNDVQQLLNDFKQDLGSKQATAFNRAKIMQQVKDIVDGFIRVTEAFRDIENLDSAVGLTTTEIENIKNSAESVLEVFRPMNKTLELYRESVMQDICVSILGETLPDGTPTVEALKGMDLSKNWGDNFYSFSRTTNPLVAAMGTVTRDAQLARDKAFNDIVHEIKQIHSKLGALKSTKFMYEKDRMHIISDIDWDAYYAAKNAYKESLESQNLKDWEIQDKMHQWWKANTEDRIVDDTIGRTEKVPNHKYRKAMPKLTTEQMEYYTAIMKLKGRMESLLDKRGRNLYRPPQVRRSMQDVLLNSGGIKSTAKGIKTAISELTVLTENDEDNAEFNTQIGGEEFSEARGTYSGEVKKQIPIFYMNRLNDVGELMLDFSSAMQAEASTATNYATMSEVLDVVEFMKDYINNDIEHVPESVGESVVSQTVAIVSKLSKAAQESGCGELMQSFIDSQFYGIKLKDKSKYRILVKKSLAYTSLKSLAMNAKGAFNNYLVGEYQMIIEAAGAEFYDPLDYIWAHGKLMGDVFTKTPGKLMDLVTHNKHSYDTLMAEKFSFMQSGVQDQAHERYYANPVMQLIHSFSPLVGYACGEHLIHYVSGYARLHNTKVLYKGKKISLYNAYEKTGDSNNPTLKLKDGVTDLYGNPITEEFEQHEMHVIKYLQQSCHGAMTDEDKSILSQRLMGRCALNFRQWMTETLARRYREEHWDGTLHQSRRGYQKGNMKLMKNSVKYMFNKQLADNEVALQTADKQTKANFRRALAAWALLAMTFSLGFLWLDDDDEGDEEVLGIPKKKIVYYAKRGALELGATDGGLIGIAMTAKQLLQSPIAAQKTVSNAMYPFLGWMEGDLDEEVDFHGHDMNKYVYKTMKYVFPFFKDIDKYYTEYVEDEDTNDDSMFDINQWYR